MRRTRLRSMNTDGLLEQWGQTGKRPIDHVIGRTDERGGGIVPHLPEFDESHRQEKTIRPSRNRTHPATSISVPPASQQRFDSTPQNRPKGDQGFEQPDELAQGQSGKPPGRAEIDDMGPPWATASVMRDRCGESVRSRKADGAMKENTCQRLVSHNCRGADHE